MKKRENKRSIRTKFFIRRNEAPDSGIPGITSGSDGGIEERQK